MLTMANTVVLIPLPVEPGDEPMKAASMTTIKVASSRLGMLSVLNPAVRYEIALNRAVKNELLVLIEAKPFFL